jgi:hypothetical protein
MAHHLWLRVSRSFGWSTLLSIKKPSASVLAVVPLLAVVRQLAEKFGHPFNLPLRPRLVILGTVMAVVGWGLISALKPKTIAAARDREQLVRAGSLPVFLSTLEKDLDAYSSSIDPQHLQKTILGLFQGTPPAAGLPAAENWTRGHLFAALRTLPDDDATLNLVMDRANALLDHQRKWLQLVLGGVVLVGYVLLLVGFGLALWKALI